MKGLLLLCLLSLTACSTFQRQIVQGVEFRHIVAESNNALTQSEGTALHVYIHGDGRPFVTPTQFSWNPSPRRPLVADLAGQDTGSAIILGRPCYFDVHADPKCHPAWWTTHRFAPEIISSMVAATNSLAAGRRVLLIGYSGGGSLAMLMAPQITNIDGVITIAANLNTDWWTDLHGYTPLLGSVNPAQVASSTRLIPQYHFFGALDSVVPTQMIDTLHPHIPPASIEIVAGNDHDCCWRDNWPQLLERALSIMIEPPGQ